uniref:Uncharacterized protein n=1 Tax=Euplotes harpa TaxID=151035 RepID=A0A7S3NAM0_9SPIT|mmetsp:Transcript_24834/g.28521  ORF Transcript_24834/g.28521 Transcript_24834/m.28521 type:complete len:121 (+) Transcript_24834:23-385(+)
MENMTINNLRTRRNGFIGGVGLRRTKLGEEEKASSNNQFVASLIMNTNLDFYKNEMKEHSVEPIKTPLSPSKDFSDKLKSQPVSPSNINDQRNIFSPKSKENYKESNLNSYLNGASEIRK